MKGIFDQLVERSDEGQQQVNQPESLFERVDDSLVGEGQAEKSTDIEVTDMLEDQRTDKRLRESSQELLRFGLLEESQKPNLYRAAIVDLVKLNAVLEPFDLCAQADEIRGLVFLKVLNVDSDDEQDEWSHPLVRKQRLTLEQTLLVAILRQYFIAHEQEAGTGSSQALVAVDELIPQLQLYLGDSGSEARERTRVLQLLDQLKGHGLVTAPDAHERVGIRPMIAHLANPENLQALLHELRERVALDGLGEIGEEAE